MIVAKTRFGFVDIRLQFSSAHSLEKGGTEKYYLCLVHGVVSLPTQEEVRSPDWKHCAEDGRGRVEVAMTFDTKQHRSVSWNDPSNPRDVENTGASSQHALTFYDPLAWFTDTATKKQYTLVHVQIITGRTHQIRFHMAEAGYPLVGDPTYGAPWSDREWAKRVFLHSYQTKFREPFTLRWFEATSPLPEDLGKTLCSLRFDRVKDGLEDQFLTRRDHPPLKRVLVQYDPKKPLLFSHDPPPNLAALVAGKDVTKLPPWLQKVKQQIGEQEAALQLQQPQQQPQQPQAAAGQVAESANAQGWEASSWTAGGGGGDSWQKGDGGGGGGGGGWEAEAWKSDSGNNSGSSKQEASSPAKDAKSKLLTFDDSDDDWGDVWASKNKAPSKPQPKPQEAPQQSWSQQSWQDSSWDKQDWRQQGEPDAKRQRADSGGGGGGSGSGGQAWEQPPAAVQQAPAAPAPTPAGAAPVIAAAPVVAAAPFAAAAPANVQAVGQPWVRKESSRTPGIFYYWNQMTNVVEAEPPPPWERRESRSAVGVFYYWNPLSNVTSAVKPEL